MKNTHKLSVILTLILIFPIMLTANNLVLENSTISEVNYTDQTADIQFDISWENSWRENGDGTEFSSDNWDAAWVFAKYSVSGGNWNHCSLALSGHTAPAGSVIENPSEGSDNRRAGVFIYRNAAGFGNNDWNDAVIIWNFGIDGVSDDQSVEIRVFGIEMCFVPEENFYAGDGNPGTNMGSFACFEGTDSYPLLITNGQTVIRCKTGQTSHPEYCYDSILLGGITIDGDGGICTTGQGTIDNPDYPTGYKGFYCMKYEISQGQWVDFCNTVTSSQASHLWYSFSDYRHGTLSRSYPNFTTTRPDRALNCMTMMEGMAYADWAGLRPLTELEFEKSCRGTNNYIQRGYSWNSLTICPDVSIVLSGTENGTETVTNDVSDGGAVFGSNEHIGGDGGRGPLRVGIFAKSDTDRLSSGATFYGIMEMSGNNSEQTVTLGNPTGRDFDGTHGDGNISEGGYANILNWPGSNGSINYCATGSGYRGGGWSGTASAPALRISQRLQAAQGFDGHDISSGFRACRTK